MLHKEKSTTQLCLQASPMSVEFQIYSSVTCNSYYKANITWDKTTALNTRIRSFLYLR